MIMFSIKLKNENKIPQNKVKITASVYSVLIKIPLLPKYTKQECSKSEQ